MHLFFTKKQQNFLTAWLSVDWRMPEIDYALKNASNSSLTWFLSVVHMPCGAPL